MVASAWRMCISDHQYSVKSIEIRNWKPADAVCDKVNWSTPAKGV